MIAKEGNIIGRSRRKEEMMREDLERQKDKYLRENEYFWKFNNHVRADPLGIQAHIAQTDLYLERSKQLRRDIQMEKLNKDQSHSRYSPVKISMALEKRDFSNAQKYPKISGESKY